MIIIIIIGDGGGGVDGGGGGGVGGGGVVSGAAGPLVFTIYTRPFGIIAQRYGVTYHLYADDTQLYISLDPDNELNFSSSLKNLEQIFYIWHRHIVLNP